MPGIQPPSTPSAGKSSPGWTKDSSSFTKSIKGSSDQATLRLKENKPRPSRLRPKARAEYKMSERASKIPTGGDPRLEAVKAGAGMHLQYGDFGIAKMKNLIPGYRFNKRRKMRRDFRRMMLKQVAKSPAKLTPKNLKKMAGAVKQGPQADAGGDEEKGGGGKKKPPGKKKLPGKKGGKVGSAVKSGLGAMGMGGDGGGGPGSMNLSGLGDMIFKRKVIIGIISTLTPVICICLIILVMIMAFSGITNGNSAAGNLAQRERPETGDGSKINVGGEYLKWVDVDKTTLRNWVLSRVPACKDGMGSEQSIEYALKYAKMFDVNPILLYSIALVETTCATNGGGVSHKAPYNINAGIRKQCSLYWKTTDVWHGAQTWCGYADCPDYEGALHDCALYLGGGYLHSREEWRQLAKANGFEAVDAAPYFWDQGGGSCPQFNGGKGVKGGSEKDPSNPCPNILGIGTIYCESKFATVEEYNAKGWPNGVRTEFVGGMRDCNVKTATLPGGVDPSTTGTTGGTTICIDPGHTVKNGGDEVDQETGLNVGDSPSDDNEMRSNWNVATLLKEILERDGYKVVLTKDSYDAYTNFKQKADIANNANARAVVRLHSDKGSPYEGVQVPSSKGSKAGPPPNGGAKQYTVAANVASESAKMGQILAGKLGISVKDEWCRTDGQGSTKNWAPSGTSAYVQSVLAKQAICLIEMPISLCLPPDNDSGQRDCAQKIADGLKEYLGAPQASTPTDEKEEDKEQWTTIALDPGASPDCSATDSTTGLDSGVDSGFYQGEAESDWAIAGMVKTELEEKGYTVILTKDSMEDNKDLRQRADKGNEAVCMVILRSSGNESRVFYPLRGSWCATSDGTKHYVQDIGREIKQGNESYGNYKIFANSQSLANSIQGSTERFGSVVEGDPKGRNRSNQDGEPTALVSSVFTKVPIAYVDMPAGQVCTDSGATEDTQSTYAAYLAEGISDYVGAPERSELDEEMAEEDGDSGISSEELGNMLVTEEEKHLGTPYIRGGQAPGGFDCSGLIWYCVQQIGLGSDWPRVCGSAYAGSAGQKYMTQIHPTKFEDLQAGDLICCNGQEHVITFAGNKEHALEPGKWTYLHSPQTGDVVKKVTVDSWSHRYFGGDSSNTFFRLKGIGGGKVSTEGFTAPSKQQPGVDFWTPGGGCSFGGPRDGGRKHAGCDVINDIGVPLYAMADGEVVLVMSGFCQGTSAVFVKFPKQNVIINYGEVDPPTIKVKAGDKVKQGQQIAQVGRLSNKGSHMLHFEMYDASKWTGRNLQWYGPTPPDGLLNPTDLLKRLYNIP